MSNSIMDNRLSISIIVIMFLFIVYGCQAVIIGGSGGVGDGAGINGLDSDSSPDVSLSTDFSGFGFVETIQKSFEFITFQSIDAPLPVIIFLNLISFICTFILVYIVFSFIYDFVKALPTT